MKLASLSAVVDRLRLTPNAQDELTLSEKAEPTSFIDKPLPGPPVRPNNASSRGLPKHRPARSEEEAVRARRGDSRSARSRPSEQLDIFADPIDSPKKRSQRRPRRNSDSSVVERSGRSLIDSDEEDRKREKRRRERRQREREREREGAKSSKSSKKPDRKLDIIDQLDATSIYGAGCEYNRPYIPGTT